MFHDVFHRNPAKDKIQAAIDPDQWISKDNANEIDAVSH
jgi:hypothetical protein